MEEINSVTESVISNWFHERLLQWGVSEGLAVYLNLLGLLFALTVIVIVVAYLTRKILVEAVSRIASKTNSRFDDFLVGNRTMAYVARIIPLIIIEIGRASCRESVSQYVSISSVAVSLKKNKYKNTQHYKNTNHH